MVFLDWKELPWHWALSATRSSRRCCWSSLVPGLLAFVFGFFAFRSRIKGVYFSIITQAMTFATMLLFFRNETGFGGNNGFTDFKRILGMPIATPSMRMLLFVLTGLHADRLLPDRALRWSRSKFGRVLQAIRDAESRVMFTGYDPLRYKLAIWTLSAVMCGVAGALYVPQVGIINPSEMTPAASIEIAIWAAVGGRGDADRPDRRRVLRQRREELVHAGLPRVLAVLPRRAVHRGHAVPAAGHRRPGATASRAARATAAEDAHDARPDARPAPHARRAAEERAASPRRPGRSGGREASYSPRRRSPASSTSRTARSSTSTTSRVSFDGFKALNALSLVDQRRRAALHHRPERRRQDDDDGRHHRQDAARRRPGVLRLDDRPAAPARERDRVRSASAASSRSRRCSSTSSVFENLELALKADRGVRASLFFRLDRRAARPHRRDARR